MTTPLDYFQMEAIERLERLSSGLMALEQSPEELDIIQDLFREAHSLKGAAGVTGLKDIAEICHRMEDLLSTVRDGTEKPGAAMIDVLLSATDAVLELVAAEVEDRDSDIVPARIVERLTEVRATGAADDVAQPPEAAAVPAVESAAEPVVEPAAEPLNAAVKAGPTKDGPKQPAGLETVRLRVDMLEGLSNLTGELMVASDRLRQRLSAVKDLHRSVREVCGGDDGDTEHLRSLKSVSHATRSIFDDLTSDFTIFEPLIAEIHERVLDTRMLPASVLFDKLRRFVRDYCRQEDKQAELRIDGSDTRVDRQVLENLRDPMVHLIRNAVSHGIEPNDKRKACGKDPVGIVHLTISRHGERIRITCEDDGGGLNCERILAKGVAKGLVSEADAPSLSDRQIERLILEPGFSTAEMITDVSGRGVGMDVVLRRIEALRGTLDIESQLGKYTRFILEFPASVATLDGLLVDVGGLTYVVPTTSVLHTTGIRLADIQTVGGEAMANIDGRAVPLLLLADLLGRGREPEAAPRFLSAVVVRQRERHVALGVDRLLGTQTIVAKSLGDHIVHARGVAGATVLGTGLPALILDPVGLVDGAGLATAFSTSATTAVESDEASDPILVVDDSITTRTMEQGILEAAGYRVDTAVTAEDALKKIEDRTYRLFVVDVEMPGLNGFQLTRKLRQDERFAETPIVIVTSLASQEHRREGLEAGANAYIVKGEFDQNNLLDSVERLVGR